MQNGNDYDIIQKTEDCESAIGSKQLTFMYGDVADRRHILIARVFDIEKEINE